MDAIEAIQGALPPGVIAAASVLASQTQPVLPEDPVRRTLQVKLPEPDRKRVLEAQSATHRFDATA